MPFFKLLNEELQQRRPFILWSRKHPERYGEEGIVVKSLNELCRLTKKDTVAEDLLDSFEKSEIYWNGYNGYNRPVIWPEELMEWHDGCCLDFAIFAHMLFDYHDIDHAIGFIRYFERIPSGNSFDGHAFIMYIQDNQTYIWNYFGYDMDRKLAFFDINGPFTDYQHALQYAAPFFSVLYQSNTKPYTASTNPRDASVVAYYTDDMLTAIDVAHDRRMRLNQTGLIKLLEEDRQRRMKLMKESSDIEYAGFGVTKPSIKGIQSFMKLTAKKSIFRRGLTKKLGLLSKRK